MNERTRALIRMAAGIALAGGIATGSSTLSAKDGDCGGSCTSMPCAANLTGCQSCSFDANSCTWSWNNCSSVICQCEPGSGYYCYGS